MSSYLSFAVSKGYRDSIVKRSYLSQRTTNLSTNKLSSRLSKQSSPTIGIRGFSTEERNVTHEILQDGIGLIRLNSPGSKVNVLNEKVIAEFQHSFNELSNNPQVKSIILISGKTDNFIAGADIDMLAKTTSEEEATNLSKKGQEVLNTISSSKIPIVAAIHGSCLGGGLELALACQYRIATKHSKTVLGLPEVQLGILPGTGGTQRLPKLVGLPSALEMMLVGSNVRPQKAKKMGLVDLLVDEIGPGNCSPEENTLKNLENIAVRVAKDLSEGTLKPRKPSPLWSIPGLTYWATTNFSFGRDYVFKKAKADVEAKTLGNYPAPLAILDVVKTGLEKGEKVGLEAEAKKFGELTKSPQAEALINIFLGQTSLKKNRFGSPQRTVQQLGILGAGLMGAGIAQVSLQKAKNIVRLKDTKLEGLGKGEQQILKNLSTAVKKKQMTQFEMDSMYSNLITQLDYKGFEKVDMVIEAVFENLEIKHRVLREVESIVPQHCIFASNTSALPIADIAKASKRPSQVIGMHYFSPVDKMPLLEVITTPQTSKDTAAAAVQIGLRQGKTVIVVKDGPGFYTTRILTPMLAEAFALMLEGVDFERLDKVMKKFGFPVGPATLADEVGIDVGNHIAAYLGETFPERMGPKSSDFRPMHEMVENGLLGRKSGKGFFLYEGTGKKGSKKVNQDAVAIIKKYMKQSATEISDEEIQLRMVGRMVNEAVICLSDGIIENAVDGDIGAVFGLGFPPFLGGPFRYVDKQGSKLLTSLEQFASKYGNHFAPSPMLSNSVKTNTSFHSSKKTTSML